MTHLHKPHTWLRSIALLAIFISTLGSAIAPAQATGTKAPVAVTPNASRSVFVQLFMWRWKDVARECETYLGPKGYGAVQVSPPQEHINGTAWWVHYQPVSYQINSDLGTRADFSNMVSRCNAVGVKIYADVVINHMANGAGTGYAGSSYSNTNHQYTFNGIYGPQDFHWNVSGAKNCQSNISNYNNQHDVQECELVGLPDLATESTYVRGKIADYLVDLWSLGVAGFRIDAVKHMDAGDVGAILTLAQQKAQARGYTWNPYVVQEIIDSFGNEAVKKEWYYPYGDVNDFRFGRYMKETFLNWNGTTVKNLRTFGETWAGMSLSSEAAHFVDNHDMQRGDAASYLTYKDNGNHYAYTLANVFMLAWPYGYPQVMSSFAFSNNDQGHPTAPVYDDPVSGQPTRCFGDWVCEHRWREIGNMVSFRNAVGTDAVANWWDNGANAIAFSRGSKGFVVINREDYAVNTTFQTGLPAGTYCDIIAGDFSGTSPNGTCSGRTITVNATGQATFSVPANYAAAIHLNARTGGSTCANATVNFKVNATTVWGQNVYVVGNISQLGSWNTGSALLMSSATYPNWTKAVTIPGNTAVQFKYIKKDGNGNVIWEGGSNRTFTTTCGGTINRTDTWQP